MKEATEPEVKLFGRKIMLPEDGSESVVETSSGESADVGSDRCSLEIESGDSLKILLTEEDQVAEPSRTQSTVPEMKESSSIEAEEPQNLTGENSRSEEVPVASDDPKSESNKTNGQPKTLKKPDKILPCPRCNSMDTKFCYYNNYNINQPRHFCKNCQRYWTAGGTMRNIPVGAGRRKTKNLTSICQHITIPEALSAAGVGDPSSAQLRAVNPSSTVLSFSPDSKLCESMASDLKLADEEGHNGLGNGVYTAAVTNRDSNGIDCTSKSAPQVPLNGFPSPVPCIAGVAPWPFPWNSGVPVPALYPVPFFPPPYWNCAMPNPWTVPWLPVLPPSPCNEATHTGNISPLGKHSRSGELFNKNKSEAEDGSELEKSEHSIVVPKTLRIDDPEEAAKSSIWETLGIKYGSISREGLFKALHPKGHKEQIPLSTSQALQANPAAFSRSISFQESA